MNFKFHVKRLIINSLQVNWKRQSKFQERRPQLYYILQELKPSHVDEGNEGNSVTQRSVRDNKVRHARNTNYNPTINLIIIKRKMLKILN